MPRRRRRAARSAAAATPSCRSTIRGPAGSSTIRRRSGPQCSRRPRRRCGPPGHGPRTYARSGSPTSARRPCSGNARRGRPVAPAIVWQDRRTAERCRELPADLIRARTGLVPDPYFSATKLEWLLARGGLPQDELAFGTVDAWLVWKLTEGREHVTDRTNASRTMLLGLDTLDWDDELLALFGVERGLLPRLAGSAEVVGEGELLGVTSPDRRHRGRPAGVARRPRLLRAGRGEGDLRHGQLRARARGGSARARPRGPARDGCGAERLRARGRDPRERRRDPVAPRRARPARGRGRERAARARGRLGGRRHLRARPRRARLAALGCRTRAA